MTDLEHQKIRAALGRVICNEREAQGLSLRKFGLMVGLDYKRMHEIEHGKANVTINSLLRICEGLGISFFTLADIAREDIAAAEQALSPHKKDNDRRSPLSERTSKPHLKYDHAIVTLPTLEELQ